MGWYSLLIVSVRLVPSTANAITACWGYTWETKSEASWGAFFAALKQRGLPGADLIVSERTADLFLMLPPRFGAQS